MSLSSALSEVALSPAHAETQPAENPTGYLGGWSKRMVDILIAAAVIVALLPILGLVALLIKWSMGGSVIYGHRRVGRDGQPFRCFKFRTMVSDADEILAAHLAATPEAAREWHATRKLKADPRITRLGRVLRASSIDELPQLFNVLAGEMSCVGPRPIMFDELYRYGPGAGEYLRVRPGLTGLWQISGRSSISYQQRVDLDLSYVRDWSLRRDLLIMLKTLPALARIDHTS